MSRGLHTIIKEQRLRDRSLKITREKQVKSVKKRNRKILETVSHHFPDIEILTRYERHKDAIEQLAKPRAASAHHRT